MDEMMGGGMMGPGGPPMGCPPEMGMVGCRVEVVQIDPAMVLQALIGLLMQSQEGQIPLEELLGMGGGDPMMEGDPMGGGMPPEAPMPMDAGPAEAAPMEDEAMMEGAPPPKKKAKKPEEE